jgi:hypothetical protein
MICLENIFGFLIPQVLCIVVRRFFKLLVFTWEIYDLLLSIEH